MAKFVAISGPSTTGKTTLSCALRGVPGFEKVKFSPDFTDIVWNDLVDRGFFSEFTEISTDPDHLCLFIVRLIDYYNNYIEEHEDDDGIIILDSCWIDFAIYSILCMWYTRVLKTLQEDILRRIATFDDKISRVYITKEDDINHPVDKFRIRGKMSTFKANRPLEVRYYDLARHLKNAVSLPSSDVDECTAFIVDDLHNLGYVRTTSRFLL